MEILLLGLILSVSFVIILFFNPCIGIILLLTVPLFKGLIREYFPFLTGYTYDIFMIIIAYFCICIDFLKKKYQYSISLNKQIKVFLVGYYLLIILCIATSYWTRSPIIAYKKIQLFAIFANMIILIPLLFFRDKGNLKRFLFFISFVGVFCGISMVFFPMDMIVLDIESTGTRVSVLGANPLIPANLISIACICIFSFSISSNKYSYLSMFVPFLLVSIFISGTRAPVFFTLLVIVLLSFIRPNVKLLKTLLYFLIFSAIFLFFYSYFEEMMYGGFDRFYKLFTTEEEGRVTLFKLIFNDMLKRPQTFAFGGGLGDTSYIYSHGQVNVWYYPHNWLLEIWSELGLAGFFIMSSIYYFIMTYTLSLKVELGRYEEDVQWCILAVGGISVYFVLNSFKTGSFSSGFLTWFFFSTFFYVYRRWFASSK